MHVSSLQGGADDDDEDDLMSRGTELSAKETPRACELSMYDIRQKDKTVVSDDTVVSDETVVSLRQMTTILVTRTGKNGRSRLCGNSKSRSQRTVVCLLSFNNRTVRRVRPSRNFKWPVSLQQRSSGKFRWRRRQT